MNGVIRKVDFYLTAAGMIGYLDAVCSVSLDGSGKYSRDELIESILNNIFGSLMLRSWKMKKILKYLLPYKKGFAFSQILMIIATSSGLLFPWFLKNFFDNLFLSKGMYDLRKSFDWIKKIKLTTLFHDRRLFMPLTKLQKKILEVTLNSEETIFDDLIKSKDQWLIIRLCIL